MAKLKEMKSFRAPDGTNWGVEVRLPGNSSALVVFHHPDGSTSRKDRYTTYNWRGAEASNVLATVPAAKIRDALTDAVIADLFRRSVLIGGGRPALSPA